MSNLIKYIIPVILLSLLTFTSCYDDKGNYDYHGIDELTIDTIGMAAAGYPNSSTWPIGGLRIGESVTAEQNFKFNVSYGNKGTDKLKYAWIMTKWNYQQVQQGLEWVWPQADTICRTQQLEWTVTDVEPTVLYWIRFMAWDPETKVKAFYDLGSVAFASEGAMRGLYVLSEYNGMTDIDIYTTPRGVIANFHDNNTDEPTVRSKVYSSVHGRMLDGKPAFIRNFSSTINSNYNSYFVFTDQDAVLLDYQTGLQIMQKKEQFFFSQPTNWNPQNLAYFTNPARVALINDGKFYSIILQADDGVRFPSQLSEVTGKDYRLSSFIAPNTYSATAAGHLTVVFDELNNCYRPYYNAGKSTLGTFVSNPEASLDVAKIKGRVMASVGTSNYRHYSLVEEEDSETASKRYTLYQLNFRTLTSSETTTFVERVINVSNCPDIANAKYFSSTGSGNAFFYATDTKVYSIAAASSTTAPNYYLIHECAAGEVVTAMRASWGAGYPFAENLFWIGTWNEGKQEGYMNEYLINCISGRAYTADEFGSFDWNGIPAAALLYPDQPYPYKVGGFGKIKSFENAGVAGYFN